MINKFNLISTIINYLSIGLLVLNLMIVPKSYGLHSITMVWITPILFFTYYYSTSYSNEWISKIMASTQIFSFYSGFSLGMCCSADTFKNMSSEVTYNIGYILIVLVVFWLAFGVLKAISVYSWGENLNKWLAMLKYYIFIVHLMVVPQICYASLNSLSNFRLLNRIDSINTTLSLLILLFVILMLVSLWYLTKISNFTGFYD